MRTAHIESIGHLLDARKTWHGPVYQGKGGCFILSVNSKLALPWNVHSVDLGTKEVRAVMPFESFEAARRAAEFYALG